MSSPHPAAPVNPRARLFGVSVAMTTPFAPGGTLNVPRAAAHATRVLASGADGVTLFGTTGEGASLGDDERAAALDAVLEAGAAPDQLTLCVCATSLEQAERQARQALSRGVRRLLTTPPFYFKDVADDALRDWFARLLDRIGGDDPLLILYHIPQVTGVAASAALARRLKDEFGPAIFGVKDSSGDWAAAQSFLRHDDLAILIGDERLLARAAPLGVAGAISGIANLYPGRLKRVIETGEEDAGVNSLVEAILSGPVTPGVKALVGALHDETGWREVRPPLSPVEPARLAELAALLTPASVVA